MMKIKAIITGSTGMVGEGVLHVCLNSPKVESVLVVNRRSCGIDHPKLKEIIHKDFMDLIAVEESLQGYNTCYFCSGVSSVGKKEDEYRKITCDLTMNFAETFLKINHDCFFAYVSGSGTDSTEKGKLAWARIKGKTENDILKLGFRDSYAYRPGYIEPYKGQNKAYKVYKFFSPIYPLLEKLFPKYVGTMEELGNSMINVTLKSYSKKVLEVADIRETSKNK
ncbi:MAG: NAD-dependent epimerase/dehydratase family protein [Melioribacteraceae bacterium]|nr:NAD-dependent epimerase/dehydratase family protein [Melioribacteraceae bacterium]